MQNSAELEQKDAVLEETAAEAPLEETPVEETPVEETPVEEIAVEEPVAEEVPATETPVEEIPVVEEAPVEEAPAIIAPPVVELPKKAKKVRRSRPWPLKILCGLIAFVLCVTMFAVSLAGIVLVDLRVMTSQGGIRQIITQLIMPKGLSAGTQYPGLTAAPSQPAGEDVVGPLVDMAFDFMQKQFGDDVPLTKEQLTEFLDQSTAKDFLADKIAGAVDDFYNETNETTITRDEVMDLIRENTQIIKDNFDIEITEEQLSEIEEALEEAVIFDHFEEKGFMGVLEETLAGKDLTAKPGDAGDSIAPAPGDDDSSSGLAASLKLVREILNYIRMATSDMAIASIFGVFLALFLLLWLTNFTIPKTLSDTGFVLLLNGLILCAPIALDNLGFLQTMLNPTLLSVIRGVLAAVAPIHIGVLAAGAGLIVLAIIAKTIKSIRLRKAAA